jgi:hypothetical protein
VDQKCVLAKFCTSRQFSADVTVVVVVVDDDVVSVVVAVLSIKKKRNSLHSFGQGFSQ